MTPRWIRLLRHRWFDERDARRLLDPTALGRIEQRIADSERRHSGEIRVCIEASLPLSWLWRHASARERALQLFGRLGVWDTEANNGALVYLLLADRAIEIVTDRGLTRHTPAGHWDPVIAAMRDDFRVGQFEPGLMRAIDAVDTLLSQHFALAEGAANPDELPNRPLVL